MLHNKYIFAGCCVDIKTHSPMLKEGTFSGFLGDFLTADYSFEVIETQLLPPKNGECIHNSGRKKVYKNNSVSEYTAFFSAGKMDFVDYACKVDDRKLYICTAENLRELAVFDALNLPSLLLKKGVALMHCSFIEHKGEAILFAGDKQVGKSTQANLWREFAGADIINGDRAGLKLVEDKLYACGVPFCGTSGICQNKEYPVKAIVCLEKWTDNSIIALPKAAAFMNVLGKLTYDNYDKSIVNTASIMAKKFVQAVPIYSFSCRKDESAVAFLKDKIYEEA